MAHLRVTGPAPRLAPVSANASAEEVLAALGKLHEAAAEVGTVRQRVEALLEFSRFALYKEFVRCLILREIRKVRAASAVLGLGRGTQDVECMPVNICPEKTQFEQFHGYCLPLEALAVLSLLTFQNCQAISNEFSPSFEDRIPL